MNNLALHDVVMCICHLLVCFYEFYVDTEVHWGKEQFRYANLKMVLKFKVLFLKLAVQRKTG